VFRDKTILESSYANHTFDLLSLARLRFRPDVTLTGEFLRKQ